jgi:hypothetical protein
MSTPQTPIPLPDDSAPSRPVLDDKKKAKIIALITVGASRRMAARYIGCAPSTITRTAARDPEFCEQLATAEQNCDVSTLQAIRVAAGNPRYWRAAAWLLERRNPNDFALRKPEVYTAAEFAEYITAATERIGHLLAEDRYQEIMNILDELCEMAKEDFKAEKVTVFRMAQFDQEWIEAHQRRHSLQQTQDENDPAHPTVQHPPYADNATPPPTLAVNLETPYTSDLPLAPACATL